MCKLVKTFKESSNVDRFKLILVLPIICVIILISEMVDLLLYIFRCVLHFIFKNCKELLIVSATAALIIWIIVLL